MTTKNQCKAASGNKGRKTPPEDPPETRFGTQHRGKSTPDGQKIEKHAKTSIFGGLKIHPFFKIRNKPKKVAKKLREAPARRDARGRREGGEG